MVLLLTETFLPHPPFFFTMHQRQHMALQRDESYECQGIKVEWWLNGRLLQGESSSLRGGQSGSGGGRETLGNREKKNEAFLDSCCNNVNKCLPLSN